MRALRIAPVLLCGFLTSVSALAQSYQWTTFAGNQGGRGIGNGVRGNAHFYNPAAVAVDGDGDFIVVDRTNKTIRIVTPAGAVSTLAGSPGARGNADGFGREAKFEDPAAVAVHGRGAIFVSDSGSHTIRMITRDGRVTTIAGSAGSAGSADGPGSEARFRNPTGLAADEAGNLFIADSSNHTIRKMSATGVVTTFAGTPGGFGGRNDGVGPAASFWNPGGLALDKTGRLLVADGRNHTIRRITADGTVTTLAGRAGSSGTSDGTLLEARFESPAGLTVGTDGTLFVTDSGNHTIRKITTDGMVYTLAGAARSNDYQDGIGNVARFYGPTDVAMGADGRLVVAD